MKKIIIVIGFLIVIILLANYTRLKIYLRGFPVYKYETKNNDFVHIEIPSKGILFIDVEKGFYSFKKDNPTSKDTILYRTFKVNPLKFWNWHDYLVHVRYKLPYKSKEE